MDHNFLIDKIYPLFYILEIVKYKWRFLLLPTQLLETVTYNLRAVQIAWLGSHWVRVPPSTPAWLSY